MEQEAWVQRIEALEHERDELMRVHAQELAAVKRSAAIELALASAGARNRKAVRALLREDAVTLDEDGVPQGLEEQIGAIRASDPYLFYGTEPAQQGRGFVPGESADVLPDTQPDTAHMSYAQLAAYLSKAKE